MVYALNKAALKARFFLVETPQFSIKPYLKIFLYTLGPILLILSIVARGHSV